MITTTLILSGIGGFFKKAFSAKYFGYTMMIILAIVLAIVLLLGKGILGKLQRDNQRLKDNLESMQNGFDSSTTYELNFTQQEFRRYLDENAKLKRDLDSMNYKISRIAYLQEYSAYNYSHGSGKVTNNTIYINPESIDSILKYLKDSLKLHLTKESLQGMDSLIVQQAPFKTNGCLEGTVKWVGLLPDSVYVDAVQKQDMVFIGYRKLNKGWFGRDLARFFTLRWKDIGTDKWETTINAWDKCQGDSINVINNKKINVIKRK